MGHYDDCYFEANRELIERANKAGKYRKEMLDNLSMSDMVGIMFADFIGKKNDSYVIYLAEKYLVDGEK